MRRTSSLVLCKDCLPSSTQFLNSIGFHSRPWNKELLHGKHCSKKPFHKEALSN